MSDSAAFAFGSTRSVVTAPSAPLAWLGYFLRPWFDASPGDASRTVELRVDPSAYEAALRGSVAIERVDCFLLDTGIVSHPVAGRHDGRLWIDDRELAVAYGVDDDGGVLVVAATDGPGARVGLMRVVRELAVTDALADGRPLLHAAAVEIDGAAVAICGSKRAGKSSLMLHMLRQTGARFVANDRAMAHRADGSWLVRGMPTITALRADSVARFPEVAARLRSARDRHWLTPDKSAGTTDQPWADEVKPIDLAPASLCALLGVEPVAETSLGTLLFPRIDPSAGAMVERPLGADQTLSLLRGSLVGAAWLGDYAGVFAAHAPGRDAWAARDAALEQLARLPAFEVLLGPSAYLQPETLRRSA